MAASSSNPTTERVLRRANPDTIHDKFLVGYQGWFTCKGDGAPIDPGHHGWLHWFDKPIPEGGRPNLDLWPDVSSYDASELYPAPGLKMKSGEPAMLFSSRNAKTVQRHFHWMAEHGVDGAFLQRFASQCDVGAGREGIRRIRDEVGDRVREAAEREGRVFAIMYDVTGVPPERIQGVLEQDWPHLLVNKRILDSPNYLREKGRPVVGLWGFGFKNAGHTPALLRSITQFFRNATPGGVYLMGGTPTNWRTGEGDADPNPEFVDVWLNEFDAISPWTIGRYRTEDEADAFAGTKMLPDIDLIKRRNEEGRSRRIDYIPVIFPGGSGYHLSEGKWAFNDAPRNGGRFLWKQVFNARRAGARIVYGAMWDEYDEGTAFLPAVPNKRSLPVSDKWNFLALDAEGHSDLPSDWYMRICGFAAEGLRSERRIFDSFPSKELQDYWSTRPKYEELPIKSADFVSGHGVGSSSGAGLGAAGGQLKDADGETYEEWLANQRTEVEEAPPPPYSLEVEELEEAPPVPAAPSNLAAVALGAASVSTLAAAGSSAYQPSNLSSGGPPANTQTHPQGYNPQPSNTPVTALTSDFNRIGLNQLAQSGAPPNSEYQPGRVTSSPPPIHTNLPGLQSYGPSSYSRPTSRPQTQPSTPSGFQSRPGSNSRPPSAQPPPNAGPPPPQAHNTSSGSGWSQGQWPPPEWGTAGQPSASNSSTPAPTSQYNQAGGASLSRPQTLTANSYNRPNPPAPHGHSNSPAPPAPYGQHGGANLSRPQTVTGNSYNRPSSSGQCSGGNSPAPPAPYGQPGGANLTRPNTFSANSYGSGPPSPNPALPPANPQYKPPGGANLSRPQTFSANSYNSAMSTATSMLRPIVEPSRPTSACGGGSNPSPSTYGAPSCGSASNNSGYGGPSPYGSSNTSGYSTSNMPSGYPPYSMPGQPSSYAPAPVPSFPGPHPPQHSDSLHFPSGPGGYSSYPSNGVGGQPSFPNSHHAGGTDGVGYPTSNHPQQWSGVGSGGPSPHGSPPISPSGMNNMNSFAHSNPYPGPTPSSSAPFGHPAPSAGPQFPHAAGGEMNYYGSANSHASSYPSAQPYGSSMPSYQGGSSSSSGGASSYANAQLAAYSDMGPNQPTPWGGVGGPSPSSHAPPSHPSLPPRPSNYTSGSYSSNSYSASSNSTKPPPSSSGSFSTTSGAGASALGLALSAVDKMVGRKTRDQLESGVGSLAQSGNKLFSKFAK